MNINALLKATGNEYATVVGKDGIVTDASGEKIDTGSYTLNAILSGSIFGGLSANKITALAGDKGVGKTFFLLQAAKNFLENNPEGVFVCFESEGATTREMIESRVGNADRIIFVPVVTVQDFRTQALKILAQYEQLVTNNPEMKMFFGLDSLGNLSTNKEVEDIEAGSDTRDMTRAQLIKATFRVLTLKLARLQVPLLVVNHTYQTMGLYAKKEMSGGSGINYAASTIVFLSKAQIKEGTEKLGNEINMTLEKGRETREGSKAKTRIFFDRGLDKYFGLTDLAEEYKIWEKSGNQFIIEEKKVWPKTIQNNPEVYFTEDILKRLDSCTKDKYLYGSSRLENVESV